MTEINLGVLAQHLNELAYQARLDGIDILKCRIAMHPATWHAVRKLHEQGEDTLSGPPITAQLRGTPVDVDPDVEPGALRLTYTRTVGP